MAKSIHEEVSAMAKTLAERITIEGNKGVVTEGTYVDTLPAGVTVEAIKALQDHNAIFYPAVTQAFGEKAIVAMKKDKSLDSVTMETPLVGKDHFDVTMSRTKTFPNPQDTDNPIVKYGSIQAQLVTQAARHNRGDMSAVKDMLAEQAMAALSK